MWALLSSATEGARRADTLEEAVDFAELVVVASYAGVERGGRFGNDATAVALLKIDSVAKGTPMVGPDGLLRVEFVLEVGGTAYPDRAFAMLERSIPTEPALLYLFTWASYLELIGGGGFPEFEARADLASTYKTIGGDGAIRIEAGRLAPSTFVDGWPTALRGKDVATVLDQVRGIAP